MPIQVGTRVLEPTSTSEGEPLDPTENKKVIDSFYAASNVGDLDTVLGLLDEDITWTNIGTTAFSGTFKGRDKLTAELLGPVFGRLKGGIQATVDHMIAEGDTVVVQVRGTAETVEGLPYNNTYCHVFRVRGARIVEATEYFDTELAARVLGADA